MLQDKGRHTIPFHELDTGIVPDEEIGDSAWLSVPPLKARDALHDPDSPNSDLIIFDSALSELLDSALSLLSEREASILRLRNGLVDGQPHNLPQVAKVHGVSSERVRQIENKALSKLRYLASNPAHPVYGLRDFMELVDYLPEPRLTDPAQDTTLRIPSSQLSSRTASALSSDTPQRQSWQAYPDDTWPDTVDHAAEDDYHAYEQTARQFAKLLLHSAPYSFQRSFARNTKSPYPKSLVDTINEQLDSHLTVGHIESFWNDKLLGFVEALTDLHGDDLGSG
jgi:hypothetical protein